MVTAKTKTTPHPYIENRDITLLFLDNKVDMPSAQFLAYQARYGGRGGHTASSKTLKNMATELGELHRHLNDMGVTWKRLKNHI